MSVIILDRDGVINFDSVDYIKSPEEWIPIPGSLEAIATLNRMGFRVVVATNQSGVARGFYDINMLDTIHEKMQSELAAVGGFIDEIFFCPHHPKEGCICRKPKPGLLNEIKNKYQINFADTFFIGDTKSDVQAANAVGCKPLLVLSGKGQDNYNRHPELNSIHVFANLAEAVDYVIAESRKNA